MTSFIKTDLIIVICAIVGIFLCCYLLFRFYRLFNKKAKPGQIQLPEYIENKHFLTTDQYELTTLGTVNKDSEYILLAVHDLYGAKENFMGLVNNDELLKNKISVITFNQRNVKDNVSARIKNVGVLVNDIFDVITALKNKYEQQKIILLLEGFSISLIGLLLKKQPLVEKVILVNPVTNHKGIRFSITSKIGIGIGFIFNLDKLLKIHIDYQVLSQNESYSQLMLQKEQTYFLNQILQFNYLNKKLLKQLNKIKLTTLIVQAENDKFYNNKKVNLINNKMINIVKVSVAKHYLFTDKNIDHKIFTEIINLKQN
ncbi:MAG: hypothetical protein EIB84_04140 [Spiroplasma poulsonii]|uniref:Serine aminopeptidase S33 domain-containing protein n=1 Tax=Spiroplasma poulsonii TaxID=2138 RepID=A0A2P6FFQ6_9MOLU|nr:MULTISPECIES: hypothetical protein [Spiroplasma]KAF0850108.1 putative transmembrane protein [Spiroplasma poulsonii]MBH8622459.1 hypothetical protein [Spiroplasma sp. hyd1]MBW1242035.1 hypothetical protein [Spiroplasma poulsonii]PQM32285.1 hypothetical protein SMSRO_SF021910 [Spiroplasma poulsonii]PWF97733.1 hypothetical protein SMH99_02820 [Spiroplasma poulsonii]